MIARLHYITQETIGFSHVFYAEQACKYGVSWVQLRVKNKPFDEWMKIAIGTQKVCKKYKTCLIINDNVTIAKEIGADGVHLGKNDMHPTEAREILGGEAIIGGTANTIEDVVQLSGSGVNYIGLGPYRFTTTKDKLSPILGLEGYMKIMREVQMMSIDIPIIAIGGIVPGDVAALMETGIYGVAVSSAINQSIDKHSVIKEFITKTVSSV